MLFYKPFFRHPAGEYAPLNVVFGRQPILSLRINICSWDLFATHWDNMPNSITFFSEKKVCTKDHCFVDKCFKYDVWPCLGLASTGTSESTGTSTSFYIFIEYIY